jgi:prepilin-type N-terminal cleavage/methylation domain-containing protein
VQRKVKMRRDKATTRRQRGFTLTEVLIATVILLVCLVAIAQLVPASILSNSANRNDSSAMVFAEQEMNQFLSQPLAVTQYTETTLNVCTTASPCLLGDPTQPDQVVGSPVVVIDNHPVIDFSASATAGYSFTYHDLNDPGETVYDVRWAVITHGSSGGVASKRFILGVTKRGGNFFIPVTLDTMVVR